MCAVFTKQLLDPIRVVDAGQLHDDAAVALSRDLWIDHAGFIDPAPHDFDRLLHRLNGPLMQRDRRQGQRDRSIRLRGDIQIGVCCFDLLAGSAAAARQRLHPTSLWSRRRSRTRF